MKWFALVCALLLSLMGLSTAALAMEGDYPWQDETVTVIQVQENPMWVPAGMGAEEYAVSVYLKISEALWKDEALCDRLYAQAQLLDPEGNAYAPGACMTGTQEPFLIYTYCIPKTVSADTLGLRLGGDGGAEGREEAEGNSVTLPASGGSLITLTPLQPGAFQAQEDKVIVHTRMGATVHNSGSQFSAGSGLKLANMRDTQQYAMLLVPFSYSSTLDFDQAADELGRIGGAAVLRVEGADYPPQVLWITQNMACYIFDCPKALPGPARFTAEGDALRIEP